MSFLSQNNIFHTGKRDKKMKKKVIYLKPNKKMCYSISIYSAVLIWSRKKQTDKCDKSELIKLVHWLSVMQMNWAHFNEAQKS